MSPFEAIASAVKGKEPATPPGLQPGDEVLIAPELELEFPKNRPLSRAEMAKAIKAHTAALEKLHEKAEELSPEEYAAYLAQQQADEDEEEEFGTDAEWEATFRGE